ncbi:holo-ACP synthase [Actinotalea sp.]|uniref:holo-ACP synthase n=1 Tax=Actinotalea sp. TaxID=1872145 RepID=UPI0035664712
MLVRPDTERSGAPAAPIRSGTGFGSLAVGVDVVAITRFEHLCALRGADLVARVFTPHEVATCRGDTARLAARFAAKEAVAKALGSGIGQVSWREIEVRTGVAGGPGLLLTGAARDRARAAGLEDWAVSLSHDADRAVAVVIARTSASHLGGREETP